MTKIRSLKELKSKAFMSVDELYIDFSEVEKWVHEDLPKLVEKAVENVRNRNEKKDDYRNYIHMYVAFMPHDAAKEFKRLLEKGVKK
jgi:hypothetical protein